MPEPANIDFGSHVIKCVKVGGLALNGFGGYTFTQDEQVDLMDENLDARIRAYPNYATALNMTTDTGFEFAQHVATGDIIVVSTRRPNLGMPNV